MWSNPLPSDDHTFNRPREFSRGPKRGFAMLLKHLKIAETLTDRPTVVFLNGKALVVAPLVSAGGKIPLAYIGKVTGYYPIRLQCGTLNLEKYPLPDSGDIWVRGSKLYCTREDWSAPLDYVEPIHPIVSFAVGSEEAIGDPIAFEIAKQTKSKLFGRHLTKYLLEMKVEAGGLKARKLLREDPWGVEPGKWVTIPTGVIYPNQADFRPLALYLDPVLLKTAWGIDTPKKLVFSRQHQYDPFIVAGDDYQIFQKPMRL